MREVFKTNYGKNAPFFSVLSSYNSIMIIMWSESRDGCYTVADQMHGSCSMIGLQCIGVATS